MPTSQLRLFEAGGVREHHDLGDYGWSLVATVWLTYLTLEAPSLLHYLGPATSGAAPMTSLLQAVSAHLTHGHCAHVKYNSRHPFGFIGGPGKQGAEFCSVATVEAAANRS